MFSTITYRDLLSRAKNIRNELKRRNYWKPSARFDLDLRLLEDLTIAYEKNTLPDFLKEKNNNGECFFMFKEIREFTHTFEIILPIIKDFDEESIFELEKNIKYILSGPQFTSSEDFNNSKARDYLFELVTATEFIRLGAQIQLREHPDILLFTETNEYMVECKRIVASPNQVKRLEKLSLEACDQLFKTKKLTGIKMGIISLDLSSMFEQGALLLPALNQQDAYKKIQTDMQETHKFLVKNKKIKQFASRGLLVGCLMNASVVTILEDKNLLTWNTQKSLMAFTNENRNRARKLLNDFDKKAIAQGIDEKVDDIIS